MVCLTIAFVQAGPPHELDVLIAHIAAQSQKTSTEPFVVGIGGCPGVGKTTLAKQLAEGLAKLSLPTTILHIDDFNLPADERKDHGEWNLDHLHLDKLKDVINAIDRGEKLIAKPTYNQVTGKCGHEVLDLTLTRVVLFEGLYATCSREPLDFSLHCSETIFIIADKEDIYQWKKERNETRLSPRNEEEFKAHMEAMLREYEKNIAYSQDDASILVKKGHLHKISSLEFKDKPHQCHTIEK